MYVVSAAVSKWSFNQPSDRLSCTRTCFSLPVEYTNSFATLYRHRIGNRGDTLLGLTSIREVASEKSIAVSSPLGQTAAFFAAASGLTFSYRSWFEMFVLRTHHERPSLISEKNSSTISQGLLGALRGSDMFRTQVALVKYVSKYRSSQLGPGFLVSFHR